MLTSVAVGADATSVPASRTCNTALTIALCASKSTGNFSVAWYELPTGFTAMGDGHFQGSRLGVDYSYAIVCKNAAGAIS